MMLLKLPGTSWTSNATTNQNLLIIASTKGHPCWLNEMTPIDVDTFARGIHNLDDVLKAINGAVVTVKYCEYCFPGEIDT